MTEDCVDGELKSLERFHHESDTDDELLNNEDEESDSSTNKSQKNGSLENSSEKTSEYINNFSASQPEKEKVDKEVKDFMVGSGSNSGKSVHSSGTNHYSHDDTLSGSEEIVEKILMESDIGDDGDEPDIVKSTKTRTPPITMSINTESGNHGDGAHLPMAPPRRKKRSERGSDDVRKASFKLIS